jgi:NADH dehydrogenase [ubiquinone] 1 alpha subcomplex assembly factor 7
LAADISRVLSQFSSTKDNSSLHLVEISPHLTQIQEKTVCGTTSLIEPDRRKLHHSLSKTGIPITWYKAVEEVPEKTGFNAFVAHEFFDALPVHKLRKTDTGKWAEVLIDFDEKDELRYVISRHETPATKTLIDPSESSTHIEVCPQSAIITSQVTERINKTNGCFLICDYGYDDVTNVQKVKDTFRAFKDHKIWDPLKEPGSADLTADVDFGYIRKQVEEKALVFGPVAQEQFLKSLGIELRLEKLMASATTEEEKATLRSGVDMVVNQMGQRFKFLSIFPKNNRQLFSDNPPAGFN